MATNLNKLGAQSRDGVYGKIMSHIIGAGKPQVKSLSWEQVTVHSFECDQHPACLVVSANSEDRNIWVEHAQGDGSNKSRCGRRLADAIVQALQGIENSERKNAQAHASAVVIAEVSHVELDGTVTDGYTIAKEVD